MPIYEYHCQDCKNTFSHLHKRLGEAAPACPKCQSQNIRKLLSTFSAGSRSAAASCPRAEQCPTAAASKHSCCSGCCHHHA